MKKLITILICALLLFAAAEEAQTPPQEPLCVLITVPGVYLRSGPTRAVPGLRVPEGITLAEVLGETENREGKWYLVRLADETEGYLKSDFCRVLTAEERERESGKPVLFYIRIAASCPEPNQVGHNWTAQYSLNGVPLPGGLGTAELREGDLLTLRAHFTENDSSPDTGVSEVSYTVTRSDLVSRFSLRFDVCVTEDRGRFSGHTAVWHVEASFVR